MAIKAVLDIRDIKAIKAVLDMPITALPRRRITYIHIAIWDMNFRAIKTIRAYKAIKAIRVIKDNQRDVL